MAWPELQPGDPDRLGAHARSGGVNFAVWSPEALQVWLCVFDDVGEQEQQRLPLCPGPQGVWHGWLPGAQAGLVYGYRAAGRWAPEEGLRFNPQRLLLDPYATDVMGRYFGRTPTELNAYRDHDPADPQRPHPDDNGRIALKACVRPPVACVPFPEPRPAPAGGRVIAEVHVRSASALHPAVPLAERGTYEALAHPALVAHWRRLGVTTVQLMPLHTHADEARLQLQGLRNHWGYSPIGFMAPEARFATPVTPAGQGDLASAQGAPRAAAMLQAAIATLRAEGFEVLLDVVFNHTGETDAQGPALSFKGLANRHWYRHQPQAPGTLQDWTGCGNTLNLSEPMVLRWVIDTLRHWVHCYGVDGFRFDLAPILGRDDTGRFTAAAGFFGALQADPVLRRCVLIAEPWDLGPSPYQLGQFPPGWLEWNDQARDALRAYWLQPGDARGSRAALAQRLAGSSERFGSDPRRPRPPSASVNFVTAHDGFTLHDLVSYEQRHNEANGEHNRDGHHDNLAWNAGVEGPSTDAGVLLTRARLQRALLATLLLARGTPMLRMGDELGQTQQGNNNAYCQDNPLSWIDWATPEVDGLAELIGELTALRRADPALHGDAWLTGQPGADGWPDVAWATPEGQPLQDADWHASEPRGLRVLLAPPGSTHCTLLLFNPAGTPQRFMLPALTGPSLGDRGECWHLRLDTEPAAPKSSPPTLAAGDTGTLAPRSVQLWCSRVLAATAAPAAAAFTTSTQGDGSWTTTAARKAATSHDARWPWCWPVAAAPG